MSLEGVIYCGCFGQPDHNHSSTTSLNSFHGTGINLFQFATRDDTGESRTHVIIPPSGDKHSLPDYYACVPAVALTTSVIAVPKSVNTETEPRQACLDEAIVEEAGWFCHALPLVEKEVITAKDAIAWTAYHASHQPPLGNPPALHALLLLFYEKSTTPAMVKHGIDVQKKAINISTQDRFLSLPLINPCLHLQNLCSGIGRTHMVSRNMLLCSVVYTQKWSFGTHWVMF